MEEKAVHDSSTRLNMSSLEHQLEEYIQTSLGWKIPGRQWSRDDDLFELGMDSLQALQLRRYLLGAIPPTEGSTASIVVPRDFVYAHPSGTRMADALRGGKTSQDLRATTETLLVEFQDVSLPKVLQEEHAGLIILLTGTTRQPRCTYPRKACFFTKITQHRLPSSKTIRYPPVASTTRITRCKRSQHSRSCMVTH